MKYVYEFIGTFFLVLTVGLTVLQPENVGALAPVAIGSILAVMIYAGAHISGAHYNPAVSLSVFMRGKIGAKTLGFYFLAQAMAGIVAAISVIYLKGFAANPIDLDPLKALLAEFLFTFALCFVVLNVATAKATAGNSFFGLAIGFTVLAGAYAVGVISGGAFNPAVAIGITLLNLSSIGNLWIYLVGNFAGAAVAALVFRQAHPNG